MMNNRFQKTLFHLSSVLTTRFPRAGSRLLDGVLKPLLGNKALVRYIFRRNLETVRNVERFDKILVIPDIHIGDAIMMQGAVMAFRDFFPGARIDYIVKNSVACLIEGNPAISNLYPLFTGTVFPPQSDVESIQRLVAENQYDLCFNCSPFFEDGRLFPRGQKFLDFLTVAPQLVRNDIDQTGVNHFLFQSYEFVRKLLQKPGSSYPPSPFRGVPVTLSDKAVEEARNFLKANDIPKEKPIIFLNPDTASPFTRIPFEHQVSILKDLTKIDGVILLGSAFTFRGIEEQLLGNLTPAEKTKITIVPTSLSLDGYAALVDFTDVFISGDTGPLHIAAARKVSKSGNFKFRNKTFVISAFGATPARMSGYDSTNPLFPPANQDILSKTYVSGSPCRNITCVNKMVKTCKTVRCFEVFDTKVILADVQSHLNRLKPAAV